MYNVCIVCEQEQCSVERKLHVTMANMFAIFLPDRSVGKGSRWESDICNASRLSTLVVDDLTVPLSYLYIHTEKMKSIKVQTLGGI